VAVVVLSIAGSDPSGGAGIQADLKTFQACGVYGAAVVTSLTVQNTVGVRDRRDVEPAFVAAQLAAVLDDLPVAAAKTGMLPNAGVVAAVADVLRARPIPALVVDPVLVATSGDTLADASTLDALRDRLVPIASVVTPNLREAEALTGRPVRTRAEMREAARTLVAMGARAALVKGGHLPDRAYDVLAIGDTIHELDAPRIDVGATHGTGCTLSAATAAGLASGLSLVDAVKRAKTYVTRALAASTPLGHGSRPLDHRVRPDDA
jgi:hydroxymethylpyrimidine/phosphomethylpyrimidine kinase